MDENTLKELLPLAARALGLDVRWYDKDCLRVSDKCNGFAGKWNPLTPGDGAEMEDKLRISVLWLPNGVSSYKAAGIAPAHQFEIFADHPDKGTARRWASLRVAAEIGRNMK